MEIRLLRYFLAVAQELHFGRAAQKLHISQPPLSQQIMKFEQELGVRLFERSKRAVSLTQAGKALENEAEKILKLVEEARRKVTAEAEGRSGILSLGYVSPAMDGPLPGVIRKFKTHFPDVRLLLHQMSTADQLIALRQGDLLVGVVRLFGQDTTGLEVRPFHREDYVLALPSDHRLSTRKSIAIRELSGEPLIFFPFTLQPGLYDAWLKTFAIEGFAPNIVQEAASKHTAVALVAAGIGLSIVPRSTARIRRKGVVFRRLKGNMPDLFLHLAFAMDHPRPVLNNFLSLMENREI